MSDTGDVIDVQASLSLVGYTLDDDRVDDELGVAVEYATLVDGGDGRLFASTIDIVQTTQDVLQARLAVLLERKRFIAAEIARLREEIERTQRMVRAATAPPQRRPRRE